MLCGMWRLPKLLGVLAASFTIATVLGGAPAQAATSHQLIYHWSGSRPVAGEVWYNAGNHNPSVGRNSFTVKDRMCGDGWVPLAQYVIYDASAGYWEFKSGTINGVSCGERSESAWTGSTQTEPFSIKWRGCKRSTSNGAVECEGWKYDVAK
ncbi:hypothetical protein Rhe02_02200 [Rhizocola hellebori]|uniref:Secreted protein n=2 Tax=Rhizocola hellebori TaxID=1392758 RepID=A0A8J3Q2A6_9ACTN|nr:hypothetical protein Rhe02_02200 [Rhizocola hellebori]